jgi:hypothetical protein
MYTIEDLKELYEEILNTHDVHGRFCGNTENLIRKELTKLCDERTSRRVLKEIKELLFDGDFEKSLSQLTFDEFLIRVNTRYTI